MIPGATSSDRQAPSSVLKADVSRTLPSTAKWVRVRGRIWLDETGRHKRMGRAGEMGSAELDRETTQPVAGRARFGGHILGARDDIRLDVAAERMQVRYALNVAAAHSLPPSPIARGSR